MPTTCWPSIRGRAMRVTKLNGCGVPVIGAKSQLATKGFVSIAFAPQYEDGTETTMKDAAGDIAFQDKAPDQLKWFQVEIKFTGVNPDLFNLIIGQPVVLDSDGNAVGIRFGQTIETNFALETWTDIPDQACTTDRSYGYFLAPWLHNGQVADFKIENAAADFTIQKAVTKSGGGWGVGPYDVVMNPGAGSDPDAPGPLLVPVPADMHVHTQTTIVAPPTLGCAAIALAA